MSANPRQDGCHGGACKRSADQANDVLSYMATLGSGFRGASAAELGGDVWVPPEWSRGGSAAPGGEGSPVPRAKGCQKQGPGCASRACNECADMAIEVLDYMSTLGDGIARATPESVMASRMNGGFVPGGHGFGGSRYREAAEDCDAKDPASACDPELSEFYVSHGPWFSRGASCYREVTCANYAANCDSLDQESSKSAAHAVCQSYSTSTLNCWVKEGGFLYWKFTPSSSGGGTCDGVWQCADINTGASCGTGSGGGLGTGTAVATNVTRTQECAGCLTGTAVEVSGPKPSHTGLAPDLGPSGDPDRDCHVSVGTSAVLGGPSLHTFIMFRDSDGRQWIYEGGPEVEGLLLPWESRGVIETTRYQDNPPTESSGMLDVTPAIGACAVQPCLDYWLQAIEDQGIYYNFWGPNSNSVTYTLLSNCGLSTESPSGYYPGWGNLLL